MRSVQRTTLTTMSSLVHFFTTSLLYIALLLAVATVVIAVARGSTAGSAASNNVSVEYLFCPSFVCVCRVTVCLPLIATVFVVFASVSLPANCCSLTLAVRACRSRSM